MRPTSNVGRWTIRRSRWEPRVFGAIKTMPHTSSPKQIHCETRCPCLVSLGNLALSMSNASRPYGLIVGNSVQYNTGELIGIFKQVIGFSIYMCIESCTSQVFSAQFVESCAGNTSYSQRRASLSSRWKATVLQKSHIWATLEEPQASSQPAEQPPRAAVVRELRYGPFQRRVELPVNTKGFLLTIHLQALTKRFEHTVGIRYCCKALRRNVQVKGYATKDSVSMYTHDSNVMCLISDKEHHSGSAEYEFKRSSGKDLFYGFALCGHAVSRTCFCNKVCVLGRGYCLTTVWTSN